MNIDIRLHSVGTNKKFQKTTKGGPQIVSSTCISYKDLQKSYVSKKNKGGQTAILVRWSADPLPSGLPKC